MKSLHVTQLFAQANTYRTPSSRERDRRALDQATAVFLKHGCSIEELPPYKAKPAPARRHRIDPDTVLCRQRHSRADTTHETAALPIIKSHRLAGLSAIRRVLSNAGLDIRPKQIELIAARHGIPLAERP